MARDDRVPPLLLPSADDPEGTAVQTLAQHVADEIRRREKTGDPVTINGPVGGFARHRGTEVSLTLRPVGWTPTDCDPEPDESMYRFFFSPLELQVVRYLTQSAPAKGRVIARQTGSAGSDGQASSKLATILSNLCERGILTVSDEGYDLTADFRQMAVAVQSKLLDKE